MGRKTDKDKNVNMGESSDNESNTNNKIAEKKKDTEKESTPILANKDSNNNEDSTNNIPQDLISKQADGRKKDNTESNILNYRRERIRSSVGQEELRTDS